MAEKTKSNTVLVKEFLCPDLSAADFMAQYKLLSDADKAQLGEGIRNGTLDYQVPAAAVAV